MVIGEDDSDAEQGCGFALMDGHDFEDEPAQRLSCWPQDVSDAYFHAELSDADHCQRHYAPYNADFWAGWPDMVDTEHVDLEAVKIAEESIAELSDDGRNESAAYCAMKGASDSCDSTDRTY